jgi:hypothetical protein
MAQVVTYANNSSQCFCQLKFESGERLLISIAGPPRAGVKVMKLLLGMVPTETVWECSAAAAGGFDAYVHRLQLMFPEAKHPLDSFRDRLLPCKSIAEAKQSLIAAERSASA